MTSATLLFWVLCGMFMMTKPIWEHFSRIGLSCFMQKENQKLKKKAGEKASLNSGWKILFKYLFECKRQVILLSVLGVISAIANGTVPYITGRFFDAILEPSVVFAGTQFEMPLWMLLVGVFLFVQLVADIVDWIINNKGSEIGMFLHSIYLAKAFSKLIRLPISFHSSKKKGFVQRTVDRAASQVGNLIENVVINLAPSFLSVIVGFMIAFSINHTLSWVLFGGIVFFTITVVKVVPPIGVLMGTGNKQWNKATGNALDSIVNIQSVKRFTSEKYESVKIYREFVNVAARTWSKIQFLWNNVSFYQRFIITVTRALIFAISVFFIHEGVITIGELIAFNGYAMVVFGPFVLLAKNWQLVQDGVIKIEEAESLLNTKPEAYVPKNAVEMKEIEGGVEFKNVDFYYKKKDGNVLHDINFKVKAGEVVALVGESGVGKSTLIDLISGYYFAQKGKVLIDGVDVKRVKLDFLRKSIAIVPQEVSLFNDTVKANIKYGNFKASEEGLMRAVKQAHADIFIEKFPKKYAQVVGERGIKLSVGQKQRIAIARAILRDPKILILDEPTSALDPRVERLITDSLKELMRGRTTFIVAHRLSTVREADRILVFKEGRIVEEGDHERLINIKDGVYKNLYELHVGLR